MYWQAQGAEIWEIAVAAGFRVLPSMFTCAQIFCIMFQIFIFSRVIRLLSWYPLSKKKVVIKLWEISQKH